MNIPKLKTIFSKFGIIRDYFPLFVPMIIFIVALISFIPGHLLSSGLKRQMEAESISKRANKISSYGKNTISSGQWIIEQAYQKAYESDANKISVLTRQTCQRPLLSYKIFPEPKDTSQLIFNEFGNKYRAGIVSMLEKINALDCPSETELERTLQGAPVTTTMPAIGYLPVQTNKNVVNETIKDELCRAKAEAAGVYANPQVFSGYDYWSRYEYTGIVESVKDCWYWQIGYWIIEDAINTVGQCNKDSYSVFTSPVKRIMKVGFSTGASSVSQLAGTDRPVYVNALKDIVITPCTGRISNDDIDVVHFNVEVLVNAKDVLRFIKQLCSAKEHVFKGWSGEDEPQKFIHNQITVLEAGITPVNRQNEIHKLYRYGTDAVVKLNLICEYIFYKSSYDEIKPEAVKNQATEETTIY